MSGRPVKSRIKERLVSILSKRRVSYGYELFRLYEKFYSKTNLRNIYYNLKRGVASGELLVIDVKRELGDYSWGDEVERIYYTLGPYAEVVDNNLNLKPAELKPDLSNEFNRLIFNLKSDSKKSSNKQRVINRCNKLISWVKKSFENPNQLIKEVEQVKNTLSP